MTLRQALDAAIARLTENDVGSPRMNAETLLMFTLGCDRAYLYAHPERELTADEQARYDAAIGERASGKPSQYITGHQEFWGLDLIVSPAVLIPRPETEHVIETVIGLPLKPKPGLSGAPRIVDVGTGSGCIALALANELPRAEIVGVDLSEAALEIARANAMRLQLHKRVAFRHSDLLEAFAATPQFDIVVSNPPYVGEAEPEKVQRQVREHEPKMAVFAGPEGLDVYRRLVPQARARLKPGGWLVLEIGFSIEAAVRALLEGFDEAQITHDLQGIPRVVAAQRSST